MVGVDEIDAGERVTHERFTLSRLRLRDGCQHQLIAATGLQDLHNLMLWHDDGWTAEGLSGEQSERQAVSKSYNLDVLPGVGVVFLDSSRSRFVRSC